MAESCDVVIPLNFSCISVTEPLVNTSSENLAWDIDVTMASVANRMYEISVNMRASTSELNQRV